MYFLSHLKDRMLVYDVIKLLEAQGAGQTIRALIHTSTYGKIFVDKAPLIIAIVLLVHTSHQSLLQICLRIHQIP